MWLCRVSLGVITSLTSHVRPRGTVMTLYLWQFVPVIIVAIACYPTALLPQPAIGSAQWWTLRPVWFALLTVVLAALTMLVMRAERPLRKLPHAVGPQDPGPPPSWRPASPPPCSGLPGWP